VTLDEVDSMVAADMATGAVSPPVAVSPVVLPTDVLPVVETPVVMVAETPGMIGMMIEVPVVVVAVVVTTGVVPPPVVGVEKPLVCEALVAAPASTPAVPLLGLKLWA
jgi:hypothetical protein